MTAEPTEPSERRVVPTEGATTEVPTLRDDDLSPEEDDSPEHDPELDYAIRTKQASFGQWASAWFYSRKRFNSSPKSRARWEKARDGELLEAFVLAEGRIVDAFYCDDVAS